ncbi:polysaccharide pyruvyl transferase family protein [uncultured Bacteroides sp.]|uniref:polysaccharide pyruvyl transferase family protein n=1 Tax=uncultured Bacteroides sp. TaxID=162156 RepID=UPI00261D797E|nr:polysaccharide pyruvyl transferase family protein [uncultured Bacteroides sp.]
MKIAILTLPLHTNYGGILQCYALQTVLERMGHKVQVLTKPQYGRSYYLIYPMALFKRLFKRFVLGKKIAIFKAPYQIVRQHTDRFIQKYIHQYLRRKWTAKIASRFDVIVVGSDQVWRPLYFRPIEEAFLSFLSDVNIKRVAYAASFGVDYCEYTEEQREICSSLLKKFSAVSVRETSGIKLCQEYFGIQAVQMLDPTLLLSTDDYRRVIKNNKTHPSQGNMLVYMLDWTKDKEDLVEHIAKEKGLNPFWIDGDVDDENLPLEKRVKMPVEQWLRSFDDADFVLTDSFHGCVFSIIFSKQFLAMGNKERGLSRFYSLLSLFSLQDRLILSSDEYKENLQLIDYDELQSKLSILQNQSISFFKINFEK